MIELKQHKITSNTIYQSLFHFNEKEDDKLLSNTKDYKPEADLMSKGKMYLLAPQFEAKKLGMKIKNMEFYFIAPYVSKSALQTSYFLNNGIKSFGDVSTQIVVESLETFINRVIQLIPKDKWYVINNHIPNICMSKSKVDVLCEKEVAVIV